MAAYLTEVFDRHCGPMDVEVWMEPFAGGAGAGLTLLASNTVEEVWLVEKNPALAALWRAMLHQGDELAATVSTTIPDMNLWHQSKEILAQVASSAQTFDDLTVGFAAFIVNRCSRSGIIAPNVGPIGGKNQTGQWLIGARYNGPELASRILTLHSWARAGRLNISEDDAIDRITDLNISGIGDEVMLFVDPPYIREGNRLYAHGMTADDHQRLADALNRCRSPWLLTYDDEPTVHETLYPERRVMLFDIPNTANKARIATELLVISDNLDVRFDLPPIPSGDAAWIA